MAPPPGHPLLRRPPAWAVRRRAVARCSGGERLLLDALELRGVDRAFVEELLRAGALVGRRGAAGDALHVVGELRFGLLLAFSGALAEALVLGDQVDEHAEV